MVGQSGCCTYPPGDTRRHGSGRGWQKDAASRDQMDSTPRVPAGISAHRARPGERQPRQNSVGDRGQLFWVATDSQGSASRRGSRSCGLRSGVARCPTHQIRNRISAGIRQNAAGEPRHRPYFFFALSTAFDALRSTPKAATAWPACHLRPRWLRSGTPPRTNGSLASTARDREPAVRESAREAPAPR